MTYIMCLVICMFISAADADIAAEKGVAGILVSNHGGRQLDTVPATVCVMIIQQHATTHTHTLYKIH